MEINSVAPACLTLQAGFEALRPWLSESPNAIEKLSLEGFCQDDMPLLCRVFQVCRVSDNLRSGFRLDIFLG